MLSISLKIKWIFWFIPLCSGFFHCSTVVDPAEHRQALLLSNEIQRKAHLENNADLLVGEIADSMIAVSSGEISISSNQEIRNRFTSYFQSVKYTSWDDVQPPIIKLSNDGSMASVFVKKLIDVQQAKEGIVSDEHYYTLFAWTAEYKKNNNQWKLYANTSTRNNLTEEQARKLPIHLSELHATIPEKDLVPEGVAFDNNTGTTYLSSTYKQKIVAIGADGTIRDFRKEGEDGLWSTVGMEVDEVNNKLWVISSNAHEVLPIKNPDPSTEWSSKIFEYQLPGGKLLNVYENEISGQYCFNDVGVSKSGKVFITESVQNKVYELDPQSQNFREVDIQDSLFVFPNGITISDDEKYLYIGHTVGIIQYDLENQIHRQLNKSSGILNNRLDGLAYYKGTLIGNQPYLNRIVQYTLDEENGGIVSQRILEANYPAFDQPSTGEVAGGSFIYLANAQMSSAFEDGILKPMDSLEDILILRAPLFSAFK